MKFGIAAQYVANGHISNAVELKKRQVIFATFVNNENIFYYIQCGNFNWNKIYNLDIGNFCKKIPKQVDFCFSWPTFGVYGFCVSAAGSSQPLLTFFFQIERYAK
jgi:hypothetical protein